MNVYAATWPEGAKLKNRENAQKGRLVMQIKGRHRELKFSNRKGNFNLDFVKGGLLGRDGSGKFASKQELSQMLKAANLTALNFDKVSKELKED